MTRKKKIQLRSLLYLVQSGRCIWCGDMMSFTRKRSGQPARDFATFEHITLRCDGGPLDLSNIVLAHQKCNLKRNAEYQARSVSKWSSHKAFLMKTAPAYKNPLICACAIPYPVRVSGGQTTCINCQGERGNVAMVGCVQAPVAGDQMAPEKAVAALERLCRQSAEFGGALTAEQIVQAIEDAGCEIVRRTMRVYVQTDD